MVDHLVLMLLFVLAVLTVKEVVLHLVAKYSVRTKRPFWGTPLRTQSKKYGTEKNIQNSVKIILAETILIIVLVATFYWMTPKYLYTLTTNVT